jgi:hypothetical protein
VEDDDVERLVDLGERGGNGEKKQQSETSHQSDLLKLREIQAGRAGRR